MDTLDTLQKRKTINADIGIIGAGVVGTAIARELSKYDIKIILIEKEIEVGFGSSKAATSIIHPGIAIANAPLKSETLLKGNLLFPELCKELDVPFKQLGELIIAENKEEIEGLRNIKDKAEKSGVSNTKIIRKEKVFELEPHINKNIVAALWLPTAGIVNPFDITIALAENAVTNGVKILLNEGVQEIKKDREFYVIKTGNYFVQASYVINAAGLYADEIASMVGEGSFSIEPHKGEEIVLDSRVGYLVNRIITPQEAWALVMPTIEGNTLLGTSYEKVKSKKNNATTKEAFIRIFEIAKRIIPEINARDIIRSFSGLRAINTRTDDFIIEYTRNEPGFINVVLGSPGVTNAPAVAKKVYSLLIEKGLKLEEKKTYIPYRSRIFHFAKGTRQEKIRMFEKDERYGHIICRCEKVSEAEVLEAIKRGARTVDGVKYRTRAGMGRCQGGFCSSRIIKILAKELNIKETDVTKKGRDSKILLYEIKRLLSKT